MKKLFTTFLMMGVALCSWASYTADYADGILTINYVDDGDSNPDIERLIMPHMRDNAETVVLTGDWANKDLPTIGNMVGKCKKNVVLDLSACTKMVSKVKYTGQGDIDWTSTNFVYLPNSNYPESATATGTATKSQKYTQYGNPYTGPVHWNPADGKPYPNDQYNSWEVLGVIEIYVDENGKELPNGSVTENPDGTYSYSYTYTIDTTPFALDGSNFSNNASKLKGIIFPNSSNFTAIPDKLCSPEICPNLETVSFNNTQIEWIGAYAFGSYGQNAQDQKQSKIGNVVFPTTLKVIGADAFKNCTQFTTVDLSQLTNLVKIDYAAFNMGDDSWNNLTTVLLPSGSNLRFFGNQVFSSSHVETLDFSNCTGIRYFAYGGQNEFGEGIKTEGTSSVATFYWYNYLKTLILPPTLELIGGGASENEIVTKHCGLLENIVFTGTEDNNNLTIGSYAFAKNDSLKNITFSPNLVKIATMSFSQDTNIEEVDLHECHRLTLIEDKAFNECSTSDKSKGIKTVIVCSHPKIIQATGGHGTGAFNNTKTIRTVEVVACDGTYADDCVCQQGAFDFDVTNVQTQIDNVDEAARLIFPRELPVREGSEYESAYDFYVGNYKQADDGSSAIITQDNLQAFYKTVPCENPSGLANLPKDNPGFTSPVGGARYYGNGWLEFINTGDAEIIPEGEFLRTYSRSKDTGVTLLPAGITAYRALDYVSEQSDYVATAKGGYVNINEQNGGEPDYQVYSQMSKEDQKKYKKYKRYALLTVKGKVMLKALRPIHQYYDYSSGQAVLVSEEDNTRSYVPERTGVVLYSTTMNEDNALLVFGNNYYEADYVFPEYPHTGGRYEAQRLEAIKKGNTEILWTDNINMLQGSYDEDCWVAPVLPWDWDNNMFFVGNKQYRNFGFSKAAAGGDGGWVRLQPGLLRLNRAYAQIPSGRFNNFNESESQMPEFYLEDRVATSSGVNTICVLGTSFDEEMTDGIQTISTSAQTYEKDAWYTLQGVKVTNPTKGIYIHNNKKVVIK